MTSFVSLVTLVYDIIDKTKKRMPVFIIGTHVYIANNLFNTAQSLLTTIIYLSLLSLACIIWEFVYAIKATKVVNLPWYYEASFAIYISFTRCFNLIVVCLFISEGRPLIYILPIRAFIYTIIMSGTIIINYFIDKFESTYWPENFKKLYNERIVIIEDSSFNIN